MELVAVEDSSGESPTAFTKLRDILIVLQEVPELQINNKVGSLKKALVQVKDAIATGSKPKAAALENGMCSNGVKKLLMVLFEQYGLLEPEPNGNCWAWRLSAKAEEAIEKGRSAIVAFATPRAANDGISSLITAGQASSSLAAPLEQSEQMLDFIVERLGSRMENHLGQRVMPQVVSGIAQEVSNQVQPFLLSLTAHTMEQISKHTSKDKEKIELIEKQSKELEEQSDALRKKLLDAEQLNQVQQG